MISQASTQRLYDAKVPQAGSHQPALKKLKDAFSSPPQIGIVTARFNPKITEPLRKGALDVLQEVGIPENKILQAWVPGAVELPLAAQQLLEAGCEAVICLGCVIRGDTDHYDYVCSMAANGIQQVALTHNAPVMFGLLTCNTEAQAFARTLEPSATLNDAWLKRLDGLSPIGNKGMDAAHAALEMLYLTTCLGKANLDA